MCPQRLFTNTELFMTAGERNSTPAPSSQTSRMAGAWEPRDPRFFLGRAVGRRGSCAPGARRGCRALLSYGRGCLCLGDATGLQPRPCLGLGRLRIPAPSVATPGAGLPDLHPSAFLSPTRPRQNSQFQRKRNPLRKLRFQTKADPAHNLKSSKQPLVFNFLP